MSTNTAIIIIMAFHSPSFAESPPLLLLLLTHKVVDSEPREDSLISPIHDANRVLSGVEARARQHLLHLRKKIIVNGFKSICHLVQEEAEGKE